MTDSLPVSQIAQAPSLEWETLDLGEGAKGPLVAQVTRLRVVENRNGFPGKECWLFLRQDKSGEIKYAFSNAPKEMPLEELAWASTLRWTIKQLFQEEKTYLGMDDYEIRSYPGVALAYGPGSPDHAIAL